MARKTIGILAHVDAGKTTFAEQLLFHTKVIKHRGRVDHKDAFLDHHDIEKERGITVFSNQAEMRYKDSLIQLIDTPGHVDFSPEMERSIMAMDFAVIILSAVEGVESHTETVWNLLRKHDIPSFFFINKTDRIGSDEGKVREEVSLAITRDAVNIRDLCHTGEMNEELIEFLAERDENLLETYLTEGYDSVKWISSMKEMIRKNRIFPCSSGSALQDEGILPFLDTLDLLTETDYSNGGLFSGRAYKVQYDKNGTKIAYIKALTGTLSVRDEICYGQGEKRTCEKITQIRKYQGNTYVAADKAESGELFAVSGLTKISPGDGLGILSESKNLSLDSPLKSKAAFDPAIPVRDVLACFNILNDEDPSLNVAWEETNQEITVQVMGKIQLEVLEKVVRERFNIEVSFKEPEIIYKETIGTAVNGFGHFEPLKHYAEVHIKLEPALNGSGITFRNVCSNDDLPPGYQNLIKQHLLEKKHHGILTGSELTDIKLTLITGRSHIKHTSGGDFRQAAYRALRQGLEKAENILLEPYYHFKITVDINHMGRVLSDIQAAFGSFNTPELIHSKAVITGKAPVATFMEYSTSLSSFTKGKGTIGLVFGGYQHCHNEEEAVKKSGYKKDRDPDYTSSSIFCARGQGYSVTWQEAEHLMHISN
ncbi:small GTP-binding protein domain-containing protein [Bacillus sp. OV322]|uniref:elongation factor G n=1 Tax=Bacillus sp. OV322 TaxID=1882764 RepID=UPI0008E8802C|nr:TetM/TetW/TetO/TetS family tetracycline resistance ribosomal protection protein [Bacillus sp. OV322]SFC68788.1 small GTP-binding protein domain-containing protein [Bacillus sp. OV322]